VARKAAAGDLGTRSAYAELPAAEARAQVVDGTLERLEAESEAQRIDIANMQGWIRVEEARWRS
jgi:hypothetical protein